MSSFFMNWTNAFNKENLPFQKGGLLFIIAEFQFIWYTLYKVKKKHFTPKRNNR